MKTILWTIGVALFFAQVAMAYTVATAPASPMNPSGQNTIRELEAKVYQLEQELSSVKDELGVAGASRYDTKFD